MPGGGMMDANTDTLARAAKMAVIIVQEIEGHRKGLDGHMNTVVPAQWNMRQSQAAIQAFKKWDMAVRNLCEKLSKLGGDTQFAMNDYSQVDDQGASLMNSCGGGMEGGGGFGGGGGGGGLGMGGGLGLGGGMGLGGGIGIGDGGIGIGGGLGMGGGDMGGGFGGDMGGGMGGGDLAGGDMGGGDMGGGDSGGGCDSGGGGDSASPISTAGSPMGDPSGGHHTYAFAGVLRT